MLLSSTETVSLLLDHMLNGERLESVVVNGVSILQTLLECRKVRWVLLFVIEITKYLVYPDYSKTAVKLYITTYKSPQNG